jgi:hypothetical protein
MNPPIRRLLSIKWLLTEHALSFFVNTKLKDIKIVSETIRPPSPQQGLQPHDKLSYSSLLQNRYHWIFPQG